MNRQNRFQRHAPTLVSTTSRSPSSGLLSPGASAAAHGLKGLRGRDSTAARATPASQVLIDRDPTLPADTPCVAIVIKGAPTEQALALTRDIREAAEKAHCGVSAVAVCDSDGATAEMVFEQVPRDALTVVIAGDGAAEVPIDGIEDMIGSGLHAPLVADATVKHALAPLDDYLKEWRAFHNDPNAESR